jgi:hypothetical protein
MATRAELWKKEREAVLAIRPKVRIDKVHIKARKDGHWDVTLEGFGFHAAIVPPTVTVGGERVEALKLQRDGLKLRGILKKYQQKRKTIVDYGFAKAEHP